MVTKAVVMPEPDFASWYRSAAAASGAAAKQKPDGAKLFQDKGCIACHSTDGSPKVGPTLKGIFGHQVIVLTAGVERQIKADEVYIRKSIVDPQADIVKGFPPVMPPQKGLLSDQEIEALMDYLKRLK